MIRVGNPKDEKALWFSEESDNKTMDGSLIAVWEGSNINEENYDDFTTFIKKEVNSDIEPIGCFNTEEGFSIFVFIVKSNISQFAKWRTGLPGIGWWLDEFRLVYGGRVAKDSQILPIIKKLGLTISGTISNVYDKN